MNLRQVFMYIMGNMEREGSPRKAGWHRHQRKWNVMVFMEIYNRSVYLIYGKGNERNWYEVWKQKKSGILPQVALDARLHSECLWKREVCWNLASVDTINYYRKTMKYSESHHYTMLCIISYLKMNLNWIWIWWSYSISRTIFVLQETYLLQALIILPSAVC